MKYHFYDMYNKNSIEICERCINVSLFHLFGVQKLFNATWCFFPSTRRLASGIDGTK